MVALVRVKGRFNFELRVHDKLENHPPAILPQDVDIITLDGDELHYAQTELGAAKVNKRVVTYFGDEARRILFNW